MPPVEAGLKFGVQEVPGSDPGGPTKSITNLRTDPKNRGFDLPLFCPPEGVWLTNADRNWVAFESAGLSIMLL